MEGKNLIDEETGTTRGDDSTGTTRGDESTGTTRAHGETSPVRAAEEATGSERHAVREERAAEEATGSERHAVREERAAEEATGSERHAVREECAQVWEAGEAEEQPSGEDKPWLAPDYPTLKNYNRSLFRIEGTVLKQYLGSESVVQIPYGVTEIGEKAFCDLKTLKKVIIPAGVEKIGGEAFCRCGSLEEAALPETVTSIGDFAFAVCLLATVIIPAGVKEIGYDAFQICSRLTIFCEAKEQPAGWNEKWNPDNRPVVWDCRKALIQKPWLLPDYPTLENYDEWYFGIEGTVLGRYFGYEGVVKIPRGVTKIEKEVFQGRELITGIIIPESVTEIGAGAFEGCSSLKEIIIPPSVTEIGMAAFRGCEALRAVVIPEGVTKIGESAFYGCSSLKEIAIPASVTSIGGKLFCNCNALEKITVNPANRAYRGMGNCLLEIKSHALIAGCKKSVIPMGVLSIAEYAFYGYKSVERIAIPASVMEIAGNAFVSCPALTIYCEAKEKPAGWDANWNPHRRPVVWGCGRR